MLSVQLVAGMDGCDISHHNGDITPQEWQLAGDAGQSFVFMKAAEGTTFVDQRFTANWANSRCTTTRLGAGSPVTLPGQVIEHPMQRGAYFFFRPDLRRPVEQAEHFFETVTKLGGNDLGQLELAIDGEDPVVNGKVIPRESYAATIADDLHQFIVRLGQLAGPHPLAYYSRASYVDALLSNATYLLGLNLWIANYPFLFTPTSIPRLPQMWIKANKKARYWQYDNGAQRFSLPIPGIGVSDRDKFLG